jgi:hypothetical protein
MIGPWGLREIVRGVACGFDEIRAVTD